MSKVEYIPKRFSRKSRKTIDDANTIIEDYQRQGYTLTLRQLYYQFVSRDLIKNLQTEYKRLGQIINDARLAGLIDWSAIEDRTRNLQKYYFGDLQSPEDVLSSAASGHEVDRWADQDNYAEVWIEKEALVGVIERTCNRWRVPYFSCRGYNSQSEQRSAGVRMANKIEDGKTVHILHLGDHDPSGINMTLDNDDRLNMFASHHANGSVKIHRLALNIDQVKKYNPPPNPTKESDSRTSGYVKKFGHKCWELDALTPTIISGLVEDKIKSLINDKVWKKSGKREEDERSSFYDAIERLKGN